MAIANITNNILTDSGIATSSLLPYTGATTNVDLGTNSISSSFIYGNGVSGLAGSIYLKQTTSIQDSSSGYSSMSAFGASSLHFSLNNGTLNRRFRINSVNLDGTNIRTYLLPDADGTIALTSDLSAYITLATTQTISGLKTFDAAISANYGIALLNGAIPPLTSIYYAALSGNSTGLSITYRTGGGTNYTNNLNFPANNNSYLFPSASGTLALTSDLGAYLPLTGGTLTGALSGTSATFSGLGTFYQLTMTGATAGRLFYAQTGGVFSQSGNLVWNNSTEQLGVGTPNPSAVVTAFSTNAATQLKAAGTAPAITFSNTLTSASLACVFGLATANNHFVTGTAAGDMAIANQSTSPGAIIFGTGTFEKMRMTSSGNFAVGGTTDDTSGGLYTNVAIDATTYSRYSLLTGGTARARFQFDGTNTSMLATSTGGKLQLQTIGANAMEFYTNDSLKATITSSGNVLIGTTTGHYATTNRTVLNVNGTSSAIIGLQSGNTTSGYLYVDAGDFTISTEGTRNLNLVTAGSAPMVFQTASTERMRITSSGDVLVGTTTATGLATGTSTNTGVNIADGVITSQINNNANQYWSKASGFTSGDFTAHFVNGSYVGGISTNGSSTNYATGSDYRLKQDFKDFTAIDLLSKIKTYDYEWKYDKSRSYGVIAHELAEIIPYAVVGEKDGERMQGVDYSKIVPILIKSIQELEARIKQLENK